MTVMDWHYTPETIVKDLYLHHGTDTDSTRVRLTWFYLIRNKAAVLPDVASERPGPWNSGQKSIDGVTTKERKEKKGRASAAVCRLRFNSPVV
jgi:hypothetical protein